MDAPFYIPANNAQGFQFFHILGNVYFVHLFVFDSNHTTGCEVLNVRFHILHFFLYYIEYQAIKSLKLVSESGRKKEFTFHLILSSFSMVAIKKYLKLLTV